MGQGSSKAKAPGGEARAVENVSANERPTVPPPFDAAKFARDSERVLSSSRAPDSGAPTVRGDAVNRASDVRGILPSSPELEQTEALGDDTVPVLIASPDELGWFGLPPQAPSLLAHIDGVSSLDAICAKANMTPQDGALILLELAEQGLVTFR